VSAPVSGLYGAVFAQWLKALAAEAAVLLHLDDEQDWLDRARAAAAGNPVASAIVRRADLLRTRAGHALERLAAELAAAGWSYQAERTRRLAATHAEASA
jgi:hypothetical protein